MNSLYAFLGYFLLAWSIYSSPSDAEPIRGGNVDVNNEAIWTVSIQISIKGNWTHTCVGTLINERDLITAAHCFVRFACDARRDSFPNTFMDLKKFKFRVVIGLEDLKLKDIAWRRGIVKEIKRVFIHKDYKKSGLFLVNDIAVIRFKKPLNDKDRKLHPKNTFDSIPLYHTDNKVCNRNNHIGQEVLGAGYGVTQIKEDGELVMNGLRKILEVTFTDKLECPFPGLILAHYIHQVMSVQGFCMGDSGGPIYFKNKKNDRFELVGVISSGPCECDLRPQSGKASKITFVPEYLHFLESIENVDESQVRKRKSLEKYERTGAMFFVLPDHNKIAKFKYFNNTPIVLESSLK